MTSIDKLPGVTSQVLVPNEKGLESVLRLLAAHPDKPPVDEIAVFTAATDAFSLANTSATVAGSLERLERIVRGALDKGIRVRGYVSVVIPCPYGGKADHRRVRDVTKELLDMVCYEVSLGDTTGTGNPTSVSEMLNVTLTANPVEKLAGHVCDHPLCITLLNYLFCFSSTILSAWESRIAWSHSLLVSVPLIVRSAASEDAHTHPVRPEMWPQKTFCTYCKILHTLRVETSRLCESRVLDIGNVGARQLESSGQGCSRASRTGLSNSTRSQAVISVCIFCSHMPTASFTLFRTVRLTSKDEWSVVNIDINILLFPTIYHIDGTPLV